MTNLWSGRFDTAPDAAAFDFGASFRFDCRLFEDDVTGSIAWGRALKNAELNLVVDLVQKNEADLEHVKNLGEKSIDEIKTALAALGLSLGMRIDPNVRGAMGRGGVVR